MTIKQSAVQWNRVRVGVRSFTGAWPCTLLTAIPLMGVAWNGVHAAADSNGGRALEEVVVTAQKKESLLSKTPISLTNVDSSVLLRNNLNNIADIQQFVPNLTVGQYYNSAKITIRGIGNENIVLGGDAGVAFHIDDVYIARPEAVLSSWLDVDRVEVLRGPQGTLYGRNATGGTVNVISKQPTEELEASIYGEVGNYDRIGAGGVISGPLVDESLLGRFSFRTVDSDGYVRNNLPGGTDTYNQDFYSLRGILSYRPTENFSIDFNARHHEDDDHGIALKAVGTLFGPSVPEIFFGGSVPEGDFVVPSNQDSFHATELTLATITMNWVLGGVKLTSISGYFDSETDTFADSDGTDVVYQVVDYSDTSEQFSQEVRLTSTANERFEWILGAYYFQDDSTQVLFTDVAGVVFSENPLIILPFALTQGGELDTESYALFGNMTWSIDEKMQLEAGIRYNSDRKEMQEFSDFPFLLTASDDEEWDEITYRLGAQYFPSEGTMLFASFSSGFKSGGFNVGSLGPAYDPETALNYELGTKTRFFADRAEVNATLFYTDYDDLQVGRVSDTLVIIDNAAAATLQGLELEGSIALTDRFRVNATFSYLNATFDEFDNTDSANIGAGVQDLSGNFLPNSPEFTYSIVPEYTLGFANGGTLTIFGNYYWQDDVYFEAFNNEPYSQTAVGRADVGVTYRSERGRWLLSTYCRNITDKEVIANVQVASALIGGAGFATLSAPRTYGLRLEYNF